MAIILNFEFSALIFRVKSTRNRTIFFTVLTKGLSIRTRINPNFPELTRIMGFSQTKKSHNSGQFGKIRVNSGLYRKALSRFGLPPN